MPKLDDDVDVLFRLPLAEFIGARKTLAARLKKDGRADDAERVKLLAKPSISAWTVNQLYWQHREAFDRLIATGQRFRKAQTSGKVADMRQALDARREVLTELSDLATEVMRNADHNPSMDTVRRVTTTLEAMSAYASLSDGPAPGRLTHDVDPPGFESFAGFVPPGGTTSGSKNTEPGADRGPRRGSPAGVVVATGLNPRVRRTEKPGQFSASKKSSGAATEVRQEATAREARRLEESRQAKIAVAKVSLLNAKKSVTAARADVQSLELQQKKADAAAKEAEKLKRDAVARLKKAAAASEDADERLTAAAAEVEEATKALNDAQRTVESATKELESLFREKL
jgi:hypothetical protein